MIKNIEKVDKVGSKASLVQLCQLEFQVKMPCLILAFIAFLLVSKAEAVGSACPHPSVPFAAKYSNLTGGPDQVESIFTGRYDVFGNKFLNVKC